MIARAREIRIKLSRWVGETLATRFASLNMRWNAARQAPTGLKEQNGRRIF
jgi:hypothetical protein